MRGRRPRLADPRVPSWACVSSLSPNGLVRMIACPPVRREREKRKEKKEESQYAKGSIERYREREDSACWTNRGNNG